MTMTRDQFRERMIDYLYGELEGEELRAFEAQLRASDDDRRELAALQATLGSVREGLAHTQLDAPPAHVRQALLAAAVAHVPRARTPRWLSTSFVAVPALAVAAAALLVVLGKQIEAPRVHVDEAAARSQLEPSAPPPSAAASAAVAAGDKAQSPAEPEATSSAPGTGAARREAASQSSAAVRAEAARHPIAQTQFAEPPPAWKRERQPPSAAERGAAPEVDALLERSSNAAAPAPQATRGGQPEAFAVRKAESKKGAPESAAQETKPSRPASDAPAPANAAPEAESSRAVSAASPAARPASAVEAPSSAGSVSAAASATRASAGFPTSTIALERRARDHISARRWREAATDYRELLRREPRSPHAAEWKKQLTFATLAQQQSR